MRKRKSYLFRGTLRRRCLERVRTEEAVHTHSTFVASASLLLEYIKETKHQDT